MEQPVLCLRGGAADAKRKEARKRKFSHLQGSPRTNEFNEVLSDVGVETKSRSRKKKSKAENENGSPAVPSMTKVQCGKAKEDKDLVASEIEVAVPDKARRFICFVGRLDCYSSNPY